MFYYAKKRRDQWIKDELGMITLAGSQIWWTWEVEDVFQRVRKGDKMAMKNFANKLSGQLVDLTDMVRGDLTKNDRKKVNCLIIIDVHARDIIDTFVRDSVLDARGSLPGNPNCALAGTGTRTTSSSTSARAGSTLATSTWASTVGSSSRVSLTGAT